MTPTADDIWAAYEKHTAGLLTKSEQAANTLRAIFLHLKATTPELRCIEVDYSGAGDSGQIETINYHRYDRDLLYTKRDTKLELDDSQPLPDEISSGATKRKSYWDPETRSLIQCEPTPCSANDLINDLAWDVAYGQHPGFEINEGAYGTVYIHQRDNDEQVHVELVHNERIEEVNTTTTEL